MGKIAPSPNDKESLKKFQDADDPDSDPDYSQNLITFWAFPENFIEIQL